MKQIKMRYASPIIEFTPATPVDILLGSGFDDAEARTDYVFGYLNSKEQEVYINENPNY